MTKKMTLEEWVEVHGEITGGAQFRGAVWEQVSPEAIEMILNSKAGAATISTWLAREWDVHIPAAKVASFITSWRRNEPNRVKALMHVEEVKRGK